MKHFKWLPMTILLLLYCSVSFYEWWLLGIVADPETINQYPFGSGGPVAGMYAYKSVDNYVFVSLISGILSACLAILFFIFRKKELPVLFFTLHIMSILLIFGGWFFVV